MLDPNKNYKAELMKLVTEFSKRENWWVTTKENGEESFAWTGDFDPIKVSTDLIKEIITPPPGQVKDNNNN